MKLPNGFCLFKFILRHIVMRIMVSFLNNFCFRKTTTISKFPISAVLCYVTIYMFLGSFYGFCGSRSTQFPLPNVKDPCHNGSHLASTYSALALLKILGYDLANIDSKSLLLSMKKLQQPDGR